MTLPAPWREWVGAAVPPPESRRQLAITRGVALVAAAATVGYLT